jgi:pantetheine-phosphate adenylyltransferase
MSSVIYALSGDPLTRGHVNIIDRALNTFEHVLVGIGINPKKKYTFTLEERASLIKRVLSPYGDRISVKPYSGLLSDFAYENGISRVIRGARNAADFDYEKLLSDINHGLSVGLETFIMVADQRLSHISSSAAKELQEHQAKNVLDYVPMAVKEALELKISEQYRIGLTGGIGAGKSYIEAQLLNINQDKKEALLPQFKDCHIELHFIDMDKIGRYILKESKEAVHLNLRKTIAETLDKKLMTGDTFNVPELLQILFNKTDSIGSRIFFEDVMAEPTMHLVRRELRQYKGIVIISSALFVEKNICDLVNNNFIFVNCPEDVQIDRLEQRGYSKSEIKNRMEAQHTPKMKLNKILDLIKEQACGSVIDIDNQNNNESDIHTLYDTIIKEYKAKSHRL